MKRSLLFVSLAMVLALLQASLAACAPSITREMLTPSPTVTATPRPTSTPDPNATPTPAPQVRGGRGDATAVLLPVMTVWEDLVLEEFPIAPAGDYDLQPGSLEKNQEFYKMLPAEIFKYNRANWAPTPPPELAEVNQSLEPFGYRLERTGEPDDTLHTLYRGNQALTGQVASFGQVELNRSGTDFILALALENNEVWVLQKERFELWFAGEPRFLPIFAGDDVIALGEIREFSEAGETFTGLPVLRNGNEAYVLELPYTGANKCPVEKFRAWQDRWVLESDGEVIIDGQRLVEQHGYDKVFNWLALNGKEFFLFQQGSRYGIYYNGEELPVQYDEIVHWSCVDQQGGQGYNFSAQGNDKIAGFYARKDGTWYYVEARPLEN